MKKQILKLYNFHFSIVEIIIIIIFSTISMLPKGFIKIGKILCVIVFLESLKKIDSKKTISTIIVYMDEGTMSFLETALRKEYSNLLLITSHIAKELR